MIGERARKVFSGVITFVFGRDTIYRRVKEAQSGIPLRDANIGQWKTLRRLHILLNSGFALSVYESKIEVLALICGARFRFLAASHTRAIIHADSRQTLVYQP
jgi:hypothetical protein